MITGLERLRSWMRSRGWQPLPFQEELWQAQRVGAQGLLHAPTGMGKTLAVWGGVIAEAAERADDGGALRVVWLTPMRALANDTVDSLREPLEGIRVPWTISLRTGDSTAHAKAKLRRMPPAALVTTPESLSLLLADPSAHRLFSGLTHAIVDEWHELLGSKRGVQVELALARLRTLAPALRTWGLSATIGNVEEAARVLLGEMPTHPARIVADRSAKSIRVESLLPESVERFPWGGHTGLHLLPRVLERIEDSRSTLLFTNTRAQCEIWYEAILRERPEWHLDVALHHGSLDRALRETTELLLQHGRLRCVVCTSSLDLGVDFSPVDQVIQVGSPKGVARLLQRAGRSGHRPGVPSTILCVPAHAMELLEFSAARTAVAEQRIESRPPLQKPLDVLAQHIATVALSGGVTPAALLAEVRRTHAYRALTDEEWRWTLEFTMNGGPALTAYPDFRRVTLDADGTLALPDARKARLHRMAIGTIVGDGSIALRTTQGKSLGTVEESFVARLRVGDRFRFAGELWELARMDGMTAKVRRATKPGAAVPRWMGGRMALSSQLSELLRHRLQQAHTGAYHDEETRALAPLLERQRLVSAIPGSGEFLVERVRTREGWHTFAFPYAGRLAHEGMATLLAWRIARAQPITFTIFANDHGFELLSAKRVAPTEEEWRALLSPESLAEDLRLCVNAAELAKRRFRDVARVAGLLHAGMPGRQKSARELQVSGALLFEVLSRFDPANLLLEQARREALEQQLEIGRIGAALAEVSRARLRLVELERLSPLAFPLWAERIREEFSNEPWEDRVRRMGEELDAAPAGNRRSRHRSPR